MERLRITIEFNKNRKEELNLYEKLQNYSNPAAYVKDVLRGLLPIPGKVNLTSIENNSVEFTNDEEDEEDLMDI
ncbi:hypothetical protein [Clostridium sp. D53t1_180928_C8]|uniref:hypothetical protein n=1 Tax=Clostridium sp. D53t1_180928_C8 TaxID=2787101 RepID=UPI0018AB7D16|nr:hypothetical protein [Clostridium sp. D53t1_180928_C8]